MIKMLLGDIEGIGKVISFETQFGIHGFCFYIWTDHLNFLRKVNGLLEEKENMLDWKLVNRWKLVNELIICNFCSPDKLSDVIKNELLDLAALVAYPLMEKIARNISCSWNEKGIIVTPISETLILTRQDSKGKIESASYKVGQRIVLLSHKLEIMKKSLEQGLQNTIDDLDKRLRMS